MDCRSYPQERLMFWPEIPDYSWSRRRLRRFSRRPERGTGIEIAAMLAIAAAAAASSAIAASQQNKNVRAAQNAAVKAATTQTKQLQASAAVERQKRIDDAQRLEGRLRVAAGESGIGFGGTYMALARQGEIDLGTNLAILNANLHNQIANVRSGGQADLTVLQSQIHSVALDSFSGFLSGAESGLAIGTNLSRAPGLGAPPPAQPYANSGSIGQTLGTYDPTRYA